MRGSSLEVALCTLVGGAVALGPMHALAQPQRPAAFFILARAEAPIDSGALPAEARAVHADLLRLRRAARDAAHLRRDRTEIERAFRQAQRAEARLSSLLSRASALTADGWLLLGDLVAGRIVDAWQQAMDRAATAGGDEPPLDLGPAIASWRLASALGGASRAATWARYYEAWALAEMHRDDDARTALAIVAASGERELAAEARLRLGELAFDANAPAIAAEWYARALPDLAPRLVPIARYKHVWSLWRAGRTAEARASSALLPADAPPEMRAELDELTRAAAP